MDKYSLIIMQLKNPIYCKNLFSKAIGQMFRFKPATMIFWFDEEQYVPLHMMFVFFSIDVIYLNNNKEIIELVKGLKPFGYYNPKSKAYYVIELAKGTIEKNKLKLGDKIIFS